MCSCLILPQHCRGNLNSPSCDSEKCGEKSIPVFGGGEAFLSDAGPVLHSGAGWAICLPWAAGDVKGDVNFPCFLGFAALF